MATELKKIVDKWPDDKIFPQDFFSKRKQPNYNWTFGPDDKLLAVYAFKVADRQIIVEKNMSEFEQGVDLRVDALTTRTKDLKSVEQNNSTLAALEKTVEVLDEGVMTKVALSNICQWEPVNFEILTAGASSCLTRNKTGFSDLLVEIYKERLESYGNAVLNYMAKRIEINDFGRKLKDLDLTDIADFGIQTMETITEFSVQLVSEKEVKRKVIFVYISLIPPCSLEIVDKCVRGPRKC